MNELIEFMNGASGRLLRVVLGLALVYVGLAVLGGVLGTLVAAVGLVPIVMGAKGSCLLQYVFQPVRK